jgi:hypothetical protein
MADEVRLTGGSGEIIRAGMAAAATITLPPSGSDIAAKAKFVRLTDVDGQTFSTRLDSEP